MNTKPTVRTSLVALALVGGLAASVAAAGPASAGPSCSTKGMLQCGPALPPPR